jgi:glycosyltransferase involved in cell wall biosynthesis
MIPPSARILFIGPHRPNRNGSQRFRMEQYFPYLEQNGFVCDYSWFIDEKDDKVFYSKGRMLRKAMIFLKATAVRLRDVLRANKYDVIFVQREAFMTGSVFFEKRFSKSRAKLVFDFDDAIWLEDISSANQRFRWLKRPSKTKDIISIADAVIAGNDFLATYACQYNKNVWQLPTAVDTNIYLPGVKSDKNRVCIGWSGSKTTVRHFEMLVSVLKELKAHYDNRIHFLLIGDKNFQADGLDVECIDWRFESELIDLNRIDIGLMPLPPDQWSLGKCSFKAIQYMSLKIPPVVSPVGMNKELVTHGADGFFCR